MSVRAGVPAEIARASSAAASAADVTRTSVTLPGTEGAETKDGGRMGRRD